MKENTKNLLRQFIRFLVFLICSFMLGSPPFQVPHCYGISILLDAHIELIWNIVDV